MAPGVKIVSDCWVVGAVSSSLLPQNLLLLCTGEGTARELARSQDRAKPVLPTGGQGSWGTEAKPVAWRTQAPLDGGSGVRKRLGQPLPEGRKKWT